MTSFLLNLMASRSGVAPYLSALCMDAPCSSNFLTISRSPFVAAICSGVRSSYSREQSTLSCTKYNTKYHQNSNWKQWIKNSSNMGPLAGTRPTPSLLPVLSSLHQSDCTRFGFQSVDIFGCLNLLS